ncbi:hypothetical protein [Pedobacter insulae]|uniref:Uncharacterized protein n=1 Tax=Pedobacter insulae TaxID=414048 RepID=A0A1I2T5G5_9SPHI|nr:hypothetical protein [Pedobacter insulae]SFG60212.1 hypothetical protein SAMN04489864_101216 [Pedobacter insulae]
MKRILYVCCVLSFVACNNKKPETTQNYPKTPTGLQGIQQSAVTTTSQAGNTGTLNPVHGAPGHRCDIAVGAPLNSKASNITPAPQTATQADPKTAPVPASSMVNEKGQRLNPEHGKPGHKCEIPVGAPLT